MYNICVFAGTTEGRELVEFLSSQPVSVTACVATEYGETLLAPSDNLTVSAKRLPVAEIEAMLAGGRFDLVVDATHPYAASITESIASACGRTDTEYLRLLRGASAIPEGAVFVPDIPSAVGLLNGSDGNILLTTGSKELGKYTGIEGFSERVYARVLPLDSSLEACRAAGLKPSHIIAMQGPFPEELNSAMLRFTSARWLVTKDGGDNGGFEEKAAAAARENARLLVIGRPPQRDGLSFSEVIELLCRRFGCVLRPRVSVVGIGPGSLESMTRQALRAVEEADCVIGAKRMLDSVPSSGAALYDAISPAAISDIIHSHPEHRRFAVVMSGDAGFFSGTKKLLPLLADCDTEVLPGLSSLSVLCARLGSSYEDVFVTSVHGRRHDIVPDVRANSAVFVLTGGDNGVSGLCRALTEAGLGDVQVSVGERLSYPDEKLTRGTAAELASLSFGPLSSVLIENEHPDAVVTHGLPDELFQRGAGEDGVVPMTKSEIRAVCLSKLRLTERAVCWDIGAGTGSVAIEMAIQAKKGRVFAVEKKPAAAELLRRNAELFSAENLTAVEGSAPEACGELPAPTHAFIGGSSGNIREILELLLRKNPGVRVVATAISLESVAELTRCMKELPFTETEAVSVSVAKSRRAGPYHLMTGQNPIYIFTMQAGGAES